MRTIPAMSQQFEALLDQLLRATGSSRTTLRLDWPELGFQVNDVAGEALVPGEKSLRGQAGINKGAGADACASYPQRCLQGWISAHYTGSAHHWSHTNVEAIETAVRRVRELIDQGVAG
jgi:hypothetical protein